MGLVKTKKARNISYRTSPCFLAPLTFTRGSRENENNPRSQTREDGRSGFYNLFKFTHFTLEISIQKRDWTSNEKNANMRR